MGMARKGELRWFIQMHATTDAALASIGKASVGMMPEQSECITKTQLRI